MSRFFINRPIVAIVIAVLMTIIGGVCILGLPIAQFPNIVPPEIQVKTHYTGADAQTIEQSVAAPIEQQMSGVDNMNYMYSVNANNGDMTLRVNFDVATDPNIDQILAQLRVSQATSQLPADVNNYGVTVQKSTSAPLMLVALYSPKQTYDGIFLANYAYINLNDQLTRVPGISNVQVFGAGQYAMQMWVKPDRLAKFGVTVSDIVYRHSKSEQRQSCRPNRQRTDSKRTKVYLHSSRTSATGITGRIFQYRYPRELRRLVCAGEGCRAHRARRPNLQRQGPAQWKTLRDPGALSASRQQRDRRGQWSKKIDGGIEATFSGGHGLRRLA